MPLSPPQARSPQRSRRDKRMISLFPFPLFFSRRSLRVLRACGGEVLPESPTNFQIEPRFTSHLNYSHRRAAIGSTFVARRAGIQQASKATTVSSDEIETKVSGSVALTPNSRLFINRVSP